MTSKRRGTRSIASQMMLAVVLANGFVVAAVAGEPAAERVELKVTASGLDLSTMEGAGAFLDRLVIAAKNACGESTTELAKRPIYEHCYQQAIADAVRDINQPVLIRAYVARFPNEAVQFGVSAGQVAAK